MGEWKRHEAGYLQINRIHCTLCGRPIVGHYWVAEVGGKQLTFCNPDHENKYYTYWLPRYGQREVSS